MWCSTLILKRLVVFCFNIDDMKICKLRTFITKYNPFYSWPGYITMHTVIGHLVWAMQRWCEKHHFLIDGEITFYEISDNSLPYELSYICAWNLLLFIFKFWWPVQYNDLLMGQHGLTHRNTWNLAVYCYICLTSTTTNNITWSVTLVRLYRMDSVTTRYLSQHLPFQEILTLG